MQHTRKSICAGTSGPSAKSTTKFMRESTSAATYAQDISSMLLFCDIQPAHLGDACADAVASTTHEGDVGVSPARQVGV
jgi:hypothetical protein